MQVISIEMQCFKIFARLMKTCAYHISACDDSKMRRSTIVSFAGCIFSECIQSAN